MLGGGGRYGKDRDARVELRIHFRYLVDIVDGQAPERLPDLRGVVVEYSHQIEMMFFQAGVTHQG